MNKSFVVLFVVVCAATSTVGAATSQIRATMRSAAGVTVHKSSIPLPGADCDNTAETGRTERFVPPEPPRRFA